MSKVTVTQDGSFVILTIGKQVEKFTAEDAWWLGHTLMDLANYTRKERRFAQYERTFKDQEDKDD